ncbi:hypothetical protein [Brevundimonas vesicularis]|uniref:hypothetical protein n=1 Tax=Brevundimonas vesicularis TaxID=41276 RepID=UPI0030EBFA08
MGDTLLSIQSFERALRLILTFVIQKSGAPLTLESLQAQEEAERSKTVGYFLAQMRKRVSIHPDVDETMKAFLRNRNIFVHDLTKVTGWALDTPEGLIIANDFLSDLQTDALWLYFWLAGLLRDWSQQIGLQTEFDDHEAMRLIDETFRPLAVKSIGELPE